MVEEARVLIVGNHYVLLAMDRKLYDRMLHMGHGPVRAPGAVMAAGESPAACVVRAAYDQLHARLNPEDLQDLGTVTSFAGGVAYKSIRILRAERIVNDRWGDGPPASSANAWPRYALKGLLPFADMGAGDHYWIDRMIWGEHFDANLHFRSPDQGFLNIEILRHRVAAA